jgi:NTP pyrophosphatase (non-canonical NTP hydrolase)
MTDLNSYQKATVSTAIYPEVGTGSQLAFAYCALGLGSEAGEVAGRVKKVIRDEDGILSMESRDAIIDELGDVLWYVARLADEVGVSLGSVASLNLGKLKSRQKRGVLAGSGDKR